MPIGTGRVHVQRTDTADLQISFITGTQALSAAYKKAVGLRASQAKPDCSQAWQLPCFAWRSEVARHAEADL